MKHGALIAAMIVTGMAGFVGAGDQPAGLVLTSVERESLHQQPILLAVELKDQHFAGLPAVLGDAKGKTVLRLEVQPSVKARAGAKPLPLEAKIDHVNRRLVDAQEWFQFPPEGKFTIQAVLEQGSHKLISKPVSIAIRRPDKKDAEWGPVDRLHHIPWSNYCTDQFCGDTFDVVKRWPDSRLTPYCHYYNGLFHQHKKEHDKAIASFQTLIKQYPKFALAADAEWAMRESQVALGKADDLGKQFQHWLAHHPQRSGKHAVLVQQAQK